MSTTNLYRAATHLYDLDPRPIFKDDIPFYLDLAATFGDPILELGCGTGRVSIELAAAGYEVWGIDLSQEMLTRLESKINRREGSSNYRLRISHGDMTAFRVDCKFSLVIIPFRSIQALPDTQAMSRCLQCVADHLVPGGRLVIHLFRPQAKLDQSWVQPAQLDWEVVNPETGDMVKRYQIRRSIDVANQTLRVDQEYRVANAANEKQCFIQPLTISYLYEDQLRKLVDSNNFLVEEEFGYFDRRPLGEGPEMVFILRAKA